MNPFSLKRKSSSRQRLDQFLASVERRAYRSALLSTRKPEDALDIVQEAMLKLVQRYSDHDPASWPLLFQRILQHAIIDWHRQDARRRQRFWNPTADEESEGDELDQLIDEASRCPSDQLANSQDMDTVISTLEALPVRQRQAFLLRAWEGFDTATTAEIMDCSEGSVKTHYFRALQTLKQAINHNHSHSANHNHRSEAS